MSPKPESRDRTASDAALEFLLRPRFQWQMRFGERCALEGLLAFLRPRLSVEIGTAQGGSLHRIAANSEQVHSFDVVSEVTALEGHFENVEFHIGDSAQLLPEVLAQFEADARNVDFVLVDGDHSAEGVQRDGRALLDSAACRHTVIVFHDAANEEVRAGIDGLRLEDHPKVALALPDFVPGYVVKEGPRRFEIWNGLALVVLDQSRRSNGAIVDAEMYDAAALNRRVRDALRAEAAGDESVAVFEADDGDLTGSIMDVPERFVPDEMGEGLVAAEHFARYWWASQLARDRRVLDAGCGIAYGSNMLAEAGAREVIGIDIAEPILEAARATTHPSVTLLASDVTALELDDASFDLVVCFEVIEHVDDPERVLDELARVLAPGGLLVISSPNRDVYVPGNPHHRHEYVPEELRNALGSRFQSVRLLRQHDWVASAIMEDGTFRSAGPEPLPDVELHKLSAQNPGSEAYTLAIAGDGDLPDHLTPLTLTNTVELRQWLDSYDEQNAILREQADEIRRMQTLNRERLELRGRLERAEAQLARMPELRESGRRAYELELRLRESNGALREVVNSPSWRITKPLRTAKRIMSRFRSS